MDPYKVLNIKEDATAFQVLYAYKLALSKWHDYYQEEEYNAAYEEAMRRLGRSPEVSPYEILGVKPDASEEEITWTYHELLRTNSDITVTGMVYSAYAEIIRNKKNQKKPLSIDASDEKTTYELKSEELIAFRKIVANGAKVCKILNKIDTYIKENGENKFLFEVRKCLLEYHTKVEGYMSYGNSICKLSAKQYKELYDFIYDMYAFNIDFTESLISTFWKASKEYNFPLISYTTERENLYYDLKDELDLIRVLVQLDCSLIPLASASDKIFNANPKIKSYGNGYYPLENEILGFYYRLDLKEKELSLDELVVVCSDGAVDKYALSENSLRRIRATEMSATGMPYEKIALYTGLSVNEIKYLLPRDDGRVVIPNGYDRHLRREK